MPTKDNSVYLNHRLYVQREYYTPAFEAKSPVTKLLRTRTGVSNPRWKQQVKDQANATTALTGTYDFWEGELGKGFVQFKDPADSKNNTVYTTRIRGDISYHFRPEFPLDAGSMATTKAYNRALIAYLKKVRSIQTGFSSPTFLGELGESIHMIRHPAANLRKLIDAYLNDIKKSKKKSPKNWKKNLSGLWLEQAFGWQPLIHDIDNAWKTYKGLQESGNRSIPVTAIGIDSEFDYNTPYTTDVYPTGFKVSGNYRSTQKAFVKFKGMVVRKVEAPVAAALDRFGFNALEFAPTAWELLPWSFLVDYFTNIGDIITSSVADRSSIAWTNISIVRSRLIETACGYDSAATDLTYQRYIGGRCDGLTSRRGRRQVQRAQSTNIGYPSFALELPSVPAQWANMLALFSQSSLAIHPQRPFRRF